MFENIKLNDILTESEEFSFFIKTIEENSILNYVNKNFLSEDDFQNNNSQSNQQQQNTSQPTDNQQQPHINQDQAVQIAQGLQNGSISQDEIEKAYKNGQLNDADIQMIQQAMQSAQQDTEDLSPEEKEKLFSQQIDQLSDNFVRLALYDKMLNLKDKIEKFFDSVNINENYYEKIKFLENYLDIAISLVYNLDVNLLYQLLLLIELKLIDILNEYLGREDPDVQQILAQIEQDLKEKEMKIKFSPENLAQQYLSGEITDDDLKELLDQGLITQETINKMQELIQQAQNQDQNQEQDQNQPQQNQDQDQGNQQQDVIAQIAQAVYNNEISADEIFNKYKNGEITSDQLEAIVKIVEQLKEQQSQAQSRQDQNQAQEQQPQQNQNQNQSDQNNSSKKQTDVSYEV